ncbi:MAG: MarR family transcriptional regulator [Methanocella sp.]
MFTADSLRDEAPHIRTPQGIPDLQKFNPTACRALPSSKRTGGTTIETSEIAVLDEKESRLVQQLENFGLCGSAARIIIYLKVSTDSTIREIGASTGLSTAMVSITLKRLRQDGIVRREATVRKTQKKAPIRFCLTGDFNHVLSIIEENKRREVEQFIRETSRVKRQWAAHFKQQGS